MSDMFNHGSHGSYGEGSRWVVKRIEHQMNALNEQGRNRLKVIGLWSQPSDIGVTISIFFMLEIKRNLHFSKLAEHFHARSSFSVTIGLWRVTPSKFGEEQRTLVLPIGLGVPYI